MSVKVYAGNLNYSTTEESLSSLFSQYGKITSVSVIKDKITGQSKGFGFVEFEEQAQAEKAIAALNGKDFESRRIRVSMAQEKPPRPKKSRSEI